MQTPNTPFDSGSAATTVRPSLLLQGRRPGLPAAACGLEPDGADPRCGTGGTIAKVDNESLFVAPLNGALAMFLSADLSPTAVDGNIFRPGDFDGIGAEEFAELQSALEQWMTAPTYDTPCAPSDLADVLAATYREAGAPREWLWSGKIL